MKKKIFIILLLLFSNPILAENYKKIELENHKIYRYNFDLSDSSIELTKALDDGKLALEDVLSCSKRHNAEAAFNGGFFHDGYRKTGVSSWLMKNEHNIFALKSKQDGLYVTKDKQIKFDKLTAQIFLHYSLNKKIEIASINNPAPSGIKLFTQNYWTSTLTNPGTFEIIVEDNIIKHINSDGNNKIPSNGFVVSVEQIKDIEKLSHLKIGEKLSYELSILAAKKHLDLSEIRLILSGSDILIKNSKIPKNIYSKNNISAFRDEPHGRTAICQFDKIKHAVYVVDHNPAKEVYEITFRDMVIPLKKNGLDRETALKMPLGELLNMYMKLQKSTELSIGITLADFARFLKKEGCKNAINLDGGGSSTLVVDSKVVNNPTGLQNINIEGKNLRPVGDIFLIKKNE